MSTPLLLSAASKSSSSGSSLFFLVIIGLFIIVYFFVLRPRQKAAQAQRQNKTELSIGDEVITIGGVRGVIVALDDELVTLATGQLPGDELGAGEVTHITFIRKAIGQQVPAPTPPGEDATDVTGEDKPAVEPGEDEGDSSTS
jgi:preprotein translocase subunit YajC